MFLHNTQRRYLYKIATNGCLINLNGNGIIGNLDFSIAPEVFVDENLYLNPSIHYLGITYDRLYRDGADFQLYDGLNLGPKFQNQSQPALNSGIGIGGSTLYFSGLPQQFNSPTVVAPHQGQVISPQNPKRATVIQVPVERRVEVPVERRVEVPVDRIVYQDRVIQVENKQTLQQLQLAQAQAQAYNRQVEELNQQLLQVATQRDVQAQAQAQAAQALSQIESRNSRQIEQIVYLKDQEIQRYGATIHENQQKIRELEATLNLERENNSSQTALLSKRDNEIAQLRIQLQGDDGQVVNIDQLKDQLKKYQEQEDKLKLELQQSNLREAAAALAATQAQEAIDKAENQYRGLQTQLEAKHKREKDELIAKIGALGLKANQSDQLRDDLAQAKREREAAQAAQVAQAEELRARLPELEAARGEAAELRARLAELEAAQAQAGQAAQAEEFRAELEAAHAAGREVEELRRELEATNAQAAQAVQAVQGEVERLRRELEATRREATQSNDQAAQLARVAELEAAQSDLVARARELKTQREALQDKELEIEYLKHEALATQAQATQRNQVRSGGGTPSASASRPTASQLVTYKFELVDADSTDYKLLRLTYLGGGNFNNKSVEFRILTRNSLVDDLKGRADRAPIIKDFLFGKIQQFNDKNSRIDDENIKRFFSSEDTKIETVGVVSMDLLKEIIKAKRLQNQDRGRSGAGARR